MVNRALVEMLGYDPTDGAAVDYLVLGGGGGAGSGFGGAAAGELVTGTLTVEKSKYTVLKSTFVAVPQAAALQVMSPRSA